MTPAAARGSLRVGTGGRSSRDVRARASRMLAVVSCAIACAPRFVPPSRGGASWRELRSAHFVLRTDLPESEARLRMADLETYRDALLAAWPARPPPREVAMFAPATADEMGEFSNDREERELG